MRVCGMSDGEFEGEEGERVREDDEEECEARAINRARKPRRTNERGNRRSLGQRAHSI